MRILYQSGLKDHSKCRTESTFTPLFHHYAGKIPTEIQSIHYQFFKSRSPDGYIQASYYYLYSLPAVFSFFEFFYHFGIKSRKIFWGPACYQSVIHNHFPVYPMGSGIDEVFADRIH